MSDTHTWNIEIIPSQQGGIGNIDESQSTYYTGPTCCPGEQVDICQVYVSNDGTEAGTIYIKDMVLIDSIWTEIYTGQYYIEAGESIVSDEAWTPQNAGTYQLGIKVWGDGENEPNLPGEARAGLDLPPYVIPTVALLGLIGFALYMGRK